jgi:2-polyprenyl-6-hydroxyphenyl methylase/3-demethylubiquinone-9 3-methyltransferase
MTYDDEKRMRLGTPRYRFGEVRVLMGPSGFHYVDFLDPVEQIDPEINGSNLSDQEIDYIERQLQSNPSRVTHQLDAVARHKDFSNARILDIGCGGGLFLERARARGATVIGIELSDTRAHYTRTKWGIEVVKRPIEDSYWRSMESTFDVVTLWDVIEHVNWPIATLCAASRMLRSGGVLLIDTPCRDAFYHRLGHLTYTLSAGRKPGLLRVMYSAQPFGHKQIFSRREIGTALATAGLSVEECSQFHELSFPTEFYLRKLLRSELAVRLTAPLAQLVLDTFPIRNKLLACGRRP